MDERAAFQAAIDQYSDWCWRLNNLYWITNKEGKRVKFEMNWAQETLFDEMHYLNVILKARQLGFSTFIQVFILDACLFNSNIRSGVIAHTREDAEAIFEDKVKYPYDNLPEGLKAAIPATQDSARKLTFGNNSSIRVGTSLRSGTLQYLHVSEYGKICAKYPDKAREIRTGALNTVDAGQVIWIESTAEGQEGHFYDLCQTAQSLQRTESKLTKLDFKFFFFPWWRHPDYQLDPAGVLITAEHEEYFKRLRESHEIDLTPEQQAWYVKKAETQQADMKREFPSTPEEAFEASVEGAYYGDHMAKAETQGRIARVPWEPRVPVHTAWDLGMDDCTAIWFVQQVGQEVRVIDFYENSGEDLAHYVKILDGKDYTYGDCILPHDAEVKELGTKRSRVETLQSLGVKRIRVVPRQNVADGINAVRTLLPRCYFDAKNCAKGIKALKAYRREWDEDRGTWKSEPRHDWASHAADAFRYLSMGLRDQQVFEDADEWPDDIGRSAIGGY